MTLTLCTFYFPTSDEPFCQSEELRKKRAFHLSPQRKLKP